MLNAGANTIPGIGPKRAAVLKNDAGIETVEDFLYYLPRKYVDLSSFKKIKDCYVNETVTVAGNIIDVHVRGAKKKYLEVVIDDGSDTLSGIYFGGIRYFQKLFAQGDYVIFSGKIAFYKYKQMTHPEFDFIDEESNIKQINTGRIVPLYRSSEDLKSMGFDSRGFRRTIKSILDRYIRHVTDTVDGSVLKKYSLMPLRDALLSIHFPDTIEMAEKARNRLAFNEVFFLQYYLSLIKKFRKSKLLDHRQNIDESLYRECLERIPYRLTEDQVQALGDIKKDIISSFPMNRLLQGDVGSGKTIVSLLSSMLVLGRGDQVALMAPTEILAVQHYNSFTSIAPKKTNIRLLTGGTLKSDKEKIYKDVEEGVIDILIGTHSLIQQGLRFRKLGLIIIDEQHRFGVEQRAGLRRKGEDTDILIMTATPIPRTLSMTLFGDLDISSIRQKPENRLPIKTMAFPQSRVRGVYNSMEKYISQGRQIYYVLPLIEESEKLDLKSAIGAYENLSNNIFQNRRVSLLHGRLKIKEKDGIMEKYKKHEIDILVSTTVIEVGIDVPNANVMIIDHAERYGLAQLHQLRGRVGRGEHQSFCVLLYPDDISEESKRRIDIICENDDGFIISEEDLKMRGAGDFLGVRQHGHPSDFEFTDLTRDYDLISYAKNEADHLADSLSDPSNALLEFNSGRYLKTFECIRKKSILSILS